MHVMPDVCTWCVLIGVSYGRVFKSGLKKAVGSLAVDTFTGRESALALCVCLFEGKGEKKAMGEGLGRRFTVPVL